MISHTRMSPDMFTWYILCVIQPIISEMKNVHNAVRHVSHLLHVRYMGPVTPDTIMCVNLLPLCTFCNN